VSRKKGKKEGSQGKKVEYQEEGYQGRKEGVQE
jgi:hypothetical protein